jgi:hypothetical protein
VNKLVSSGMRRISSASVIRSLSTTADASQGGETGAGVAYMLLSSTAIGLGIGLTDWGCYSCDYTPAYVGLGVGTAIWLASVFDASPSARRHNRKAAAHQAALTPVIDGGLGGARLGLKFALRP